MDTCIIITYACTRTQYTCIQTDTHACDMATSNLQTSEWLVLSALAQPELQALSLAWLNIIHYHGLTNYIYLLYGVSHVFAYIIHFICIAQKDHTASCVFSTENEVKLGIQTTLIYQL